MTNEQKTEWFDLDGTLLEKKNNPADVYMDSNAKKYLELSNPKSVFIISGRGDRRVSAVMGFDDKTHTADMMLDNIADKFVVLSNHALSCTLPDGTVFLHPDLEAMRDDLPQIFEAADQIQALYKDQPLIIEKKATGVTINVNNIASEEKRQEILDKSADLLRSFEKPGFTHLAREPGPDGKLTSVEFRPEAGKGDGFDYFSSRLEEMGLLRKGPKTFYCDSLGEPQSIVNHPGKFTGGGTDLSLAKKFWQNGDDVIQVLDSDDTPRSPYATGFAASPVDLGHKLLGKIS